jgi:alpha-1,6-mannosyltransferase
VKFLPMVLAPLYWRRVRMRDALVAAMVVGMLYVPFLDHWLIPMGSLSVYLQRFRFNDPIFSIVERIASPPVATGLAVLVGLATAVWLRCKQEAPWPNGWAWPMAASLACAPVVYPWYLLWLLPFLGSTSTLPLMVWTVSILPTYIVWHLRSLGQAWQVPGWVLLLEYGSVTIAAAVVSLRRYGTTGRAASA